MNDTYTTLHREGDISIITMDDGKANAFSLKMSEDFNGCLEDVPKDGGALIITNRSKIFSGGFDLKTIQSGDAEATRKMRYAGLTLLADLFSFPRPVVIACNGHAVALGAFLLLTADYRIGADGDFRVRRAEQRRFPDEGKVIGRCPLAAVWKNSDHRLTRRTRRGS